MKRVQQGFTLIELMIVVAIIGILAAVAIPQYQNYVLKSRMANVLSSVDALKTAVAVCVQENGGDNANCDDTANGGAAGVIPTFSRTNEVTSATVINGQIVATLATGQGLESTAGTAGTVTFTPNINGTSVTWAVTTSGLKTDVAAAATKNSASGT